MMNGVGAGPHGGGGHGGGGGHHGGGGGGHHGGGFHRVGRGRFFGPRFGPAWWWGPEIVVVESGCVWREVGALPGYVFAAFASAVPATLADGTIWKQAEAGGAWWAQHTGPSGSAVFYRCDFSGPLAGLPDGEKAMTMQAPMTGLGAIHIGTPRGLLRTGLGSEVGLGIPGPWGDNPTGIAAGGYEITGTLVRLRTKPGTSQPEVDPGVTFNPIESSPNVIAGTPDQVDFAGTDAKDATATADGLTWAYVNVKTGPLAGKQGFVAMKFMGPVGWSAGHGGTGPMPQGQQPGPSPTPADQGTAVKKTNYIPWIVGGVVLAGVVVGGAVMGKKHVARRRAAGHHAPAHAHEARRRRRRYR